MHVSQLFFQLLRTAEFEHCFAPSFVCCETRSDFLLNEPVDVKAKLGIELRVRRPSVLEKGPPSHW
jgi:hypothetical protein